MRLFWPSLILAILALIITIPVYVIYWKGPAIRKRSAFACQLAQLREVNEAASRSGTLADPTQIADICNRYRDAGETLKHPTPTIPEANGDDAMANTADSC